MSGLFPGSEKLVQGKAPRQILLLVGPPGCGKTTFLQQFVYDRLSEGETCLYIVTDYSPNIAVENMRFLGFDVAPYVERGLLCFIDCYSGRAGLASSSRYVVEKPESLTDLGIVIDEAKKGLDKMCFALDSITTLSLDAGLNATRRFMQTLLARLRQAESFGLCIVDLGVLEETFMNSLRIHFDGVLEMKMEETEIGGFSRLLRVFSLKTATYTTTWAKIERREKGIWISSS